MKPLIYIYGTPEYIEKQTYLNYRDALMAAGAEVLHTSDPTDAAGCSGLLLPGGGDIASFYYGMEDCGSNPPDPLRDAVEVQLTKEFLEQKKPIFGICRGAQVINVVLGGTLIQDMSGHKPEKDGDPWLRHSVDVTPGSLMERLLGGDVVVNSFHHQAMDLPGKGMLVTMRAKDGTVEAMEHETLPIIATQWHPERMTGKLAEDELTETASLFTCFVQWCKDSKGAETPEDKNAL